jgi:hypothetical protein
MSRLYGDIEHDQYQTQKVLSDPKLAQIAQFLALFRDVLKIREDGEDSH